MRSGVPELAARALQRISGSPPPAGPTGRLVPRPARGRWSATAPPPRTCTARPSTASAALACGWIWLAPACCTASGCAASGADGDARDQLGRAYQIFDSIGAAAFAGRARIELRATGGTNARQHTIQAPDTPTAQEALIARLAGEGASNPQIAAQLFISPATVAYHLRKVFTKLGISSRSQLAPALPARQGAVPLVTPQADSRAYPRTAAPVPAWPAIKTLSTTGPRLSALARPPARAEPSVNVISQPSAAWRA